MNFISQLIIFRIIKYKSHNIIITHPSGSTRSPGAAPGPAPGWDSWEGWASWGWGPCCSWGGMGDAAFLGDTVPPVCWIFRIALVYRTLQKKIIKSKWWVCNSKLWTVEKSHPSSWHHINITLLYFLFILVIYLQLSFKVNAFTWSLVIERANENDLCSKEPIRGPQCQESLSFLWTWGL